MIGTIINGRYKVKEIIGEGGMANVYLATDLILDRDVAVKIMRENLSNSQDYIRRFNREGYAASSLAHPNIVSIFDVGEENGNYFIVMEYVQGMTLKEYIQHFAPIPMEKVVDIMKQLTSALTSAHRNQIVHRDIKPQNILINQHGEVKITDFGIATAVSAATLTQTSTGMLGSVHYLSPEQAKGGFTSHKSDIYSLGIVMFELLTGRAPFAGDSAVAIALKHLQSEMPSAKAWNSAIPQSVENAVMRATAKDPNNRYPSAEAMYEDLETVLDIGRLNEPKYTEHKVPYDSDETKVIPAISDRLLRPEVDPESEEPAEKSKKPAAAKSADKKKKSKKKLILILSAVGVALLVFLYLLLFTNLFTSAEVEVPDVSNMTIEDAKIELEKAGLVVRNEKAIDDDEIEENLVVRTDPEAGKKVKKNSKVDIFYSRGVDAETVEDYTGQKYDDIKSKLEDTFKSVETNFEYHDTIPAGHIIKQDPPVGREVVLADTVLVLTISNGSNKQAVDNYVGRRYADVEKHLNDTFKSVKKVDVEDNNAAVGTIVGQTPSPGTEAVLSNTDIEVRVVVGKPQVTLENLVGYTRQGLDGYAKQSGFRIKTTEEFSDKPEGTVISQDPPAGRSYPHGTEVTVVISKGKQQVTVKNLTGYSLTALDDYARESGLKVRRTEEFSNSVAKGLVISQSPAAGTRLDLGATINVVISRGEAPQ